MITSPFIFLPFRLIKPDRPQADISFSQYGLKIPGFIMNKIGRRFSQIYTDFKILIF